MMKFLVKQQKIEVLEREIIASDQIAFVSVKFVFDGAWKTLHKVVQFTQCEETYNLVLGIEGTTCLLPSEHESHRYERNDHSRSRLLHNDSEIHLQEERSMVCRVSLIK